MGPKLAECLLSTAATNCWHICYPLPWLFVRLSCIALILSSGAGEPCTHDSKTVAEPLIRRKRTSVQRGRLNPEVRAPVLFADN